MAEGDAQPELDLRETRDLVQLLAREDQTVAPAVAAAGDALASAIDAIVERLERGGRLVYVGAGSSGLLAALDAAECGPTFGCAPGQVIALVAGGADVTRPLESSGEDDAETGAAHIHGSAVGPEDAVVGVSASGTTPYTVHALRTAAAAGALTVAVVCTNDSELGHAATHEIAVAVGRELIEGSTRLKAGTAQKLVLNTISTVTMVRLGRTFGPLMVGAAPANDKLRLRARRAVELAAEVGADEAAAALARADGDPRVAIVALRLGVEEDAARARLDAAGGVVRRALA